MPAVQGTMSVQFFNANGEAMFKIFVGRDKDRNFKAGQVARFGALEGRFVSGGEA